MTNKIEILAPCGGFDSVIAAVRSGADAVYLGSTDFSARAGADNFDNNALREAVDYCHVRGVKVYLTLNTIVFDNELESVKNTIISAAEAKVDALIVQNMGLAQLCKKLVPELPLHASTQMSIHSPSGVKLLFEQGFKRVVLARELNRGEIKEIAESCPDIELEVFVHGALCVSVSGQCLFSAVIGSRSGNRGRCAQTCRLPFYVDGKSGYALSLKDNSIIDFIPELEKIGVASAKIEGRLKRPEYVAASVKACVQSRDEGKVDSKTRNELESVFSRTGFTDGYYVSKRGYEMFGYRQKEDVVSATSKLLADIRNSYKDEAKRVDVAAEFSAEVGESPVLFVSSTNLFGKTVSLKVKAGQKCEKAINRPLIDAAARKQLLKTGGTPFRINELKTIIGTDVSVPVSLLNNLRRDALDELSRRLIDSFPDYKILDYDLIPPTPHKSTGKKRYARFVSTKIGSGFKKLDLCFIPIDSTDDEISRLIRQGFHIGVEIPRTLFSRESQIIEKLDKIRSLGVVDVLCNNLAAVYIAKQTKMKIHGGFGLNFTNSLDLLWAQSYGFADTELSFEIKSDQIERLGADIPRGIVSYGYIPVMLTRNCPNKSVNLSCRNCGGQSKMKDRLGKTFIFYCDKNAAEILNTVLLDAVELAEQSSNLDFESFRFSVENYVEKVETFPDFIAVRQNCSEKTHGLYLRGVK
ncbi:MAG: U32 family peptidase [Ruminococcus sp.]|nr:U32 family peptidase [Ruminococcus sp.]